MFVEIGRIDAGAVEKTFFMQDDRHRIYFFAGRAAGMPYFDEGEGLEHGYDFLANGNVKWRVAEHLRDVD